MKTVSVIGSSQITKDSKEYKFAYTLGKEIAKRKLVVACGGGNGIMEAVCKGAKEENGLTVGIMISYTGEEANKYVDIKVNTGMSWNRNPIVSATGDVVIAVSGNYGTLSEIAYALLLNKTVLGYKTHKIDGLKEIEKIEEVLPYLEKLLN